MDFIDKFRSALPEEINFDDLYDLAPADLWKSDPRKAGVIAINRADCFDRNAYLEKYDDVRENGNDALEHYVMHGIDENRNAFFTNYNRKIECKRRKQINENCINVVYICDYKYCMPTIVSIKSLLENTDYKSINIYVISNERIDNYVNKYISNINFIFFENEFITDINLFHQHVSKSALLKFSIPSILKDIDKVIYLDSDIIINNNLHDLYSINLDDYYAAATNDMYYILHKNITGNYYNSGAMLLNLKKLRDDNAEQKLISLKLEENDKNKLVDQNIFNTYFRNKKIKSIDIRFNNLYGPITRKFKIEDVNRFYNINYNDFNDLVNDSYIIHFADREKPWEYKDCPLSDLFFKYYSMIYKNEKRILIYRGLTLNNEYKNVDYIQQNDVENELLRISLQKTKNINYDNRVILSLTSHGERLKKIHLTLFSLLNQRIRPKTIWLNLEDYEDAYNIKYLNFFIKNGLHINISKHYRAYNKSIDTILKNPDNIIVTVDDDIFYDEYMLYSLINSYESDKNSIHSHRTRKIVFDKNLNPTSYISWKIINGHNKSFLNLQTGVGGVLYPPNCLFSEFNNKELYTKLSPYNDDLWLWSMAILHGRQIVNVGRNRALVYTNPIDEVLHINTLGGKNIVEDKNKIQFDNIIKYFPKIKRIILNNN